MKLLPCILLSVFALSCNNAPDTPAKTQPRETPAARTATIPLPANGLDNYEYQPHEYQFHGLLIKLPVFSEENEDIATDSCYCIKLDKKINAVSTDTTDESEYTGLAIDTLQLAPAEGVNLSGHFYHNVIITGSLFHADNGNHHTPVLIWTTEVQGEEL